MSEIAENLQAVTARIAGAARAAGRDPATVRLLAVSKTKPATDIRAAYRAGQRAFGESYLQEALGKLAELSGLDIEWHFIGRLQSNKTRQVAEHFAWVHGLADLHHAERLAAQRPPDLAPLAVCLQVNLSGEASKGGVAAHDLPALAAAVAVLPGLRLRGLMTMPDPHSPPDVQRAVFGRLRELLTELNRTGLGLDTLSMGMSGDLEAAIAEGATIVRVGTAIFGSRA